MQKSATTQHTVQSSMPKVPSATLQRACACGKHTTNASGECEECKKKREAAQLQRSAIAPAPDFAPPIVYDVLRSAGQPLDAQTRAFMEPHFGHDFSQVRVHTDPQAAQSAQAVNALAYTVGNHVAFGAGEFQPSTNAGRELLAHELTHVVQQGPQSLPNQLPIERADSPLERSAQASARGFAETATQQPAALMRAPNPNTPAPATDQELLTKATALETEILDHSDFKSLSVESKTRVRQIIENRKKTAAFRRADELRANRTSNTLIWHRRFALQIQMC